MGTRIDISGLTKKFNEQVAVQDLDLNIGEGELLVLLGPSGCGKTTTMRCTVGLETASKGRIRFGDTIVFDSDSGIDHPANKREAGMVFQSYAIWPHMTVADNVAFPLRTARVSRSETQDRVLETLSLVGLEGMERRGASQLSGGQMQRVALARSLIMNPRLLLLDEPLSNLDAKLRHKLRSELKEVQRRVNTTCIYVTHDQAEALALADRIAVMNAGEIIQLSDPVTLYRCPETRFVADFLGMSNLLEGDVVCSERGRMTVRLRGSGKELESTDFNAVNSADGAVTVCFRPHDVLVSTEPPEAGTVNVLDARVSAASFLGERMEYSCELDDGSHVYASGNVDSCMHTEGATVHLSIDSGAVRLLNG